MTPAFSIPSTAAVWGFLVDLSISPGPLCVGGSGVCVRVWGSAKGLQIPLEGEMEGTSLGPVGTRGAPWLVHGEKRRIGVGTSGTNTFPVL